MDENPKEQTPKNTDELTVRLNDFNDQLDQRFEAEIKKEQQKDG